MTSVWQAAAMAGVPSLQLMRWNHRYHLWPTSGMARGLGNSDVVRLLHLSELIARGVPEPEAAAQARALQLPDDVVPSFAASDLVAAARSMDVRALDQALSAGLAGPLTDRLDGWLMPELRRIGEAWAGGEITVAQEDFCSTGVVAALYTRLRELPPAPDDAPLFLVGLPEGELHEIPLLATAVLLRHDGAGVDYLGPDTPASTWLEHGRSEALAGFVTAARSPLGARRANDLAQTLRQTYPGVPVWVGGSHAHRVRRARSTADSIATAVGQILA